MADSECIAPVIGFGAAPTAHWTSWADSTSRSSCADSVSNQERLRAICKLTRACVPQPSQRAATSWSPMLFSRLLCRVSTPSARTCGLVYPPIWYR